MPTRPRGGFRFRTLAAGIAWVQMACAPPPTAAPTASTPAPIQASAPSTTEPTEPAAAPTFEPPRAYPQIRLHADNPWADEADFWTSTIARDGAFERVHEWSNGGGEPHNVERCIGRVPVDIVTPWLRRLSKEATLAVAPAMAPPGQAPVAGEARYEIGYAADADTTRYADPIPMATDLDALDATIAQAKAEAACTLTGP